MRKVFRGRCKQIIAITACLGAGIAQAQIGEQPPHLNLRDTTIFQSDSLVFAPQTFAMCLYTYDSKYEVIPDTAQSELGYFSILITAKQRPKCATAAGYSGPVVVFKNLPLGKHRLFFTDSSDFQIAIPDSVHVQVIEGGSAIRPRKSGTPAYPRSGITYYSMDGRIIQRPRSGPVYITASKNKLRN